MGLGSPSLRVSVMIVCLLGSARCSVDDKNNCMCPKIPPWNYTEAPPGDCFSVGHRYRYKCNEGKVRKAGTSNLIRCIEIKNSVSWTTNDLECIDDPKRPRPPKTTVPVPENATTLQTATEADHTTAVSATTEASRGTTDPSQGVTNYNKKEHVRSSETVVGISCISLVIICASIGGSLYYCKRRRRRNKENHPETPEEQVPMNVSP